MKCIDSHCHLDDRQFDADREQVVERALAAGVDHMLAIGTGQGPPDLEAGIRLAERFPCLWATVGIHPHDAAKADAAALERLRQLLTHHKVVALGEIGLDYHYNLSPPDRQRAVFIEQLAIAREAAKPVVIHTRQAWRDTLDLLRRHWPASAGGIMHCFTGGPDEARQALELGFHLSFGGIVTYPKAAGVRQAALLTPLDRLLIETDAPYLAPVPHRGKRNEPAFLLETARRLAALRQEPLEALAALTAANFRRLCLPPLNGSEYTGTS